MGDALSPIPFVPVASFALSLPPPAAPTKGVMVGKIYIHEWCEGIIPSLGLRIARMEEEEEEVGGGRDGRTSSERSRDDIMSSPSGTCFMTVTADEKGAGGTGRARRGANLDRYLLSTFYLSAQKKNIGAVASFAHLAGCGSGGRSERPPFRPCCT